MQSRTGQAPNASFFSSSSRHTRWTGDWSSDVCSSDLPLAPSCLELPIARAGARLCRRLYLRERRQRARLATQDRREPMVPGQELRHFCPARAVSPEIGRAACREECEAEWAEE